MKYNCFSKKFYIKDLIVFLFFIFLLFQNALTSHYDFFLFDYFDEIVCLFMIIYLLLNYKKLQFLLNNKIQKNICIFFTSAMLIGAISSMINKYQGFLVSCFDFFICIKFYISYLFAKIYFKDDFILSKSYINKIMNIISIFISILFFIDLIFKIFPRYDIRYGFESIELFFGHPFNLSIFCIIMITYLTSLAEYNKKNYISIFLMLIVLFFTLRSASICFVLIYFICFIFTKIIYFKKINYKAVIFFCLIFGVFIIGFDQFYNYYGENSESVRKLLVEDGFYFAKLNFPLGLGFGTFGSTIALQYDSVIYQKMNYYSIWGFSHYATDSFLGLTLGQFGIIGTILIYLSLIYICIYTLKINNKRSFLCLIPIFFYLIISTISFTSIFHPSFFLIMFLYSYLEQFFIFN